MRRLSLSERRKLKSSTTVVKLKVNTTHQTSLDDPDILQGVSIGQLNQKKQTDLKKQLATLKDQLDSFLKDHTSDEDQVVLLIGEITEDITRGIELLKNSQTIVASLTSTIDRIRTNYYNLKSHNIEPLQNIIYLMKDLVDEACQLVGPQNNSTQNP